MNKKRKKKSGSTYKTVLTVLITAVSVSLIGLIIYGWNILGFSSHEVYYISATDTIGNLPAKRKFKPGEEVVVRAGSVSKVNYEFVGWKDVNNVIEGTGGILESGAVFIMPDKDVCLEAVWEKITPADLSDTPVDDENEPTIYRKAEDKEYVNIRSSCDYTDNIVAKISETDVDIKYYGRYQNVYDETDKTEYAWYYVEIPSMKIKGWVRSDMLMQWEE